MLLACNYSPELMGLLSRGEVYVDFIKAGAFGLFLPELDNMRVWRPVLLHGMGSHERAGMPDYATLDFSRMNRLIKAYGSPHLAIHMGITNADAPGLDEEAIHRRMVASACHFMRNLSVPLLLENTGDTPEERTVFNLIPFVEPAQINRLLDETGAGLLLDIAHAKVTAQFRGWDVESYLMEFPLGSVREIHITGTGYDPGGAPYDAHGPMDESDYSLLAWALAHTRPQIVTLEYGYPAGFAGPAADTCILREQLKKISKILNTYKSR